MDTSQIFVSVVLTTYNRSHLLMRAVNSVLEGGYEYFELIIVDDCSSDNTSEVVSGIHDSRVRYIKLDNNNGVLAARNKGFDQSHGDLIAILDDDDMLVPGALKIAVEAFMGLNPAERGILWFDCIDKESGEKSGNMQTKDKAVSFCDYVCGRIQGDFWLVFDKRVLATERFDERLRAHESLFWLRLHRLHPAKYFPIILCEKFREHGKRLCDLDVRIQQLPQTIIALTEFQQQFGKDLKQLCPRNYGAKLAYLGLHQLMIGDFKTGRKTIINSLFYRFSFKYLGLCCLSFFTGKDFVKKIYLYVEN